MKKTILLSIIFFAGLISCSKEDLNTDKKIDSADRYDFPQGSQNWDNEIVEIYSQHKTKLIYKGFKKSDFNLSWTTMGGNVMGDDMKENDISRSVDFMKNNIFKFINSTFSEKLLPPYIYLAHDMRTYTLSTTTERVAPLALKINGMDFWSICLTGETPWQILNSGPIQYLTGKIEFPETPYDVFYKRGMILKEIFKIAVTKGKIKVPADFNNGFDFTTATVSTAGSEGNVNNYKRRGFPGQIRTVPTFDFSALPNIYSTSAERNFIDYIHLCMRYTVAELETIYPKSQFPVIHTKYKECADYILNEYQVDLSEISDKK
ncbi:MAG: hypothetical protein EOM61_06465 [Bacteroidia bacterium]|nr:hypothetical protein [Bacteroidia bacterium]